MNEFEQFKTRFAAGEPDQAEEGVDRVRQQSFVDEFFGLRQPENGEILPPELHSYNFNRYKENYDFIRKVFRSADTALPINNLAEIATVMNEANSALGLLDLSLKMQVNFQSKSYLRRKVLSLMAHV